jgi:hypothetical protein
VLLCTLLGHTKRTYTAASYFLDIGADPNYVAFTPVDCWVKPPQQSRKLGGTFLYLPTPLLSLVLNQKIQRILDGTMDFIRPVVEIIHLFITFGGDIERKFLSTELGGGPRSMTQTVVSRPVYEVNGFGKKGRVYFLVEINCVDLILAKLAQSRDVAYREKLEIIKHLGLDVARAYHKILLCFCGGIAYGVNDEDTGAMDEIWNWEQSRMPQEDEVNIEEDDGYTLGSYDSVYSDDSEDGEYSDDICGLEDKKRFRKAYELLKGNEVHDIREWLSGRGYTLPEDKDFLKSSQASIHEMAEVYKSLNERFGLR